MNKLMRKGQLTVYLIIGLLIIVLMYFLLPKKIIKNSDIETSNEVYDFERYFIECSKVVIIETNNKYGLHDSIKADYENYASIKMKECSFDFLEKLRDKGMTISDTDVTVTLDINDVNIIVTLVYPVKIQYGTFDYTFKGYTQTFDRIVYLSPEDTVNKNIYSTDNNFVISSESPLEIRDIKGKPIKNMQIKIMDKRDISTAPDDLISNLVYGFFPIGGFSMEPIHIKIFIGESVPKELYNKLRIAWFNPFSGTWIYLADTKVENGYLEADIKYSTYYGISIAKPVPPGVPTLDTSKPNVPGLSEPVATGTPGFGTTSGSVGGNTGSGTFTPPTKDYQMYSGDVGTIFNEVSSEMFSETGSDGLQYGLSINPDCVPQGFICYAGSTDRCGQANIYCTESVLGMTSDGKNTIFRHEITHNIQQNNNGCEWGDTMIEWGPEYYSGSTYYAWKMEEGYMSAQDAADLMLSRDGCNEDLLMGMTFCVPGQVDEFKSKCTKPGELYYEDFQLHFH